MKPEFQAKFLQYLNSTRKEDEGFTLIELLVVIIIIGILAAIALPSLLGQANKAKQSEARNNVGAMMRGQQAAFLENQGFTSSVEALGLGIQTQTVNYQYRMVTGGTIQVAGATIGSQAVRVYATPIKPALKSYVGIVATLYAGTGNQSGESTTSAKLCETIKTGSPPVASLPAPGGTGPQELDCAKLPDVESAGWKDLGS
ncbi:type IV pilin-like G/H family protein [Spirulina major]|uniref:type IV pilin-like G/H family protein n=1 Tax=Spirulina major TaxID=270636 RepID=UPI000A055F66|nr:type IV pilin-like G/H family protein [Spirulina major]